MKVISSNQSIEILNPALTISLLELLRSQGFYITANCGGKGNCGKCSVKIIYKDKTETVLSCRVKLGDLEELPQAVEIPENKDNFTGETTFYGENTESGLSGSLGIGIDIGTTTIAVALADTVNGRIISKVSAVNSQRQFGTDVISRIEASKTDADELHRLISSDILKAINMLLEKSRIEKEQIKYVAVAGNTAMLSILLKKDTSKMGVVPFIFDDSLKSFQTHAFNKVFNDNLLNCNVAFPPCISAYIGADITAGAVLCGMEEKSKNVLFIDVGTNGEILLNAGGKTYAASTAAGPALEGGNISCGMASSSGAVSFVEYGEQGFNIKTIEDTQPVGICGSGVIDTVAALKINKLMDETGLLEDDYFDDGVRICENVVFTQKDVRNVQLAKSAVRAGIECIVKQSGISAADIDTVFFAGGFGAHIQISSAIAIGLLPVDLADKIIPAGNTSLGGAVQLLWDKSFGEKMEKLLNGITELRLGSSKEFSDAFIECMEF